MSNRNHPTTTTARRPYRAWQISREQAVFIALRSTGDYPLIDAAQLCGIDLETAARWAKTLTYEIDQATACIKARRLERARIRASVRAYANAYAKSDNASATPTPVFRDSYAAAVAAFRSA